jgi:signal transduction histidine kinase
MYTSLGREVGVLEAPSLTSSESSSPESSALRILLLEDPQRAGATGRCLDGELSTVRSLREATAYIADEMPDVAVIDLAVPDAADIEGVAALSRRFSRLPIVVLVDDCDGHTAERLLHAGAQECVRRDDIDRRALRRTLRHAVVRKHTEQMRRDREAGESANRAKSAFLSQMSHELRTPLTAILGFAQLLEMQSDDAEQDLVRPILRAGRQLQRLIEEILDIARIDAGEVTLSLEPVHVAEVLDEALAIIGPLAAARGIRLSGQPTPDVFVLADRQRIGQVLLNLLSNAVKYDSEGGRISVECTVVNGRLRIEVRDTGTGLSPEQVAALFAPFNRVTDDGMTGAGLGLVITKRLVEAMGGVIGLDSIPGTGTTAWTEWTLVPDPALQAARAAGSASGIVDLSGLVLYIEDNFVNVALVQTVLARHPGVRLMSVMKGHLGLELAEEHQPHAVLLDSNLPDMTGEEALAQLRAQPETRHIPVIVISADASPATAQRMLARGAHAYLVKPFKIDELEDALATALREAAADPE